MGSVSASQAAQQVKTKPMPFNGGNATASLLSGLEWSEVVAMAVHKDGAFGFRADGTYEKMEDSKDQSLWQQMQHFGALGLALPGSRIISFGFTSPTVLDMENQTMTILGKSRWCIGTRAVVRPLSSPDTVLLFHEYGLFSFNINDGSYTKLSKERWAFLKALVVDPEKDIAYAFHDNGVYKVDLVTGISEKINGESWALTRCAVWTPTGILVLHFSAIYRFDVQTGKYRKEGLPECWGYASHAVDVGDGTALVFHSSGLYKLNLSDASYSKVENAGSMQFSWYALSGVWAMRPETRCVNNAAPINS